MAKICSNIVFEDKYFFRTQRGELICRTNGGTELIMEVCRDFDAISDRDGSVHILAADGEGNLVYVKNVSDRWGKGYAASGIWPENIFVCRRGGGMEIFYTSGSVLYSQFIGNEIHKPVVVDEISSSALPFATGGAVYYVNKKGSICKNGKEILAAREVTHIFATGKQLCFKEREGLKLVDSEKLYDVRALTRRHGRNAQCPVVVNNGYIQILCWIDGGSVFSARKTGADWQRIEETKTEGVDAQGIFKFCKNDGGDAVYDIGFLKEGVPTSWNRVKESEKKSVPSVQSQAGQTQLRRGAASLQEREKERERIKAELLQQSRTEQLFEEIREIHGMLVELDKKIEKLKKIPVSVPSKKKHSGAMKQNLVKMTKK